MKLPSSVVHGLYGIFGLFVPAIIICLHYGGDPSMIPLIAVAIAFVVGEWRGKNEMYQAMKEQKLTERFVGIQDGK